MFQLSLLWSNLLNQLLPPPKDDFHQLNHLVIQTLTFIYFHLNSHPGTASQAELHQELFKLIPKC